MMADIEKALAEARKPGGLACPECQEELYSPMDKLSIYLHGKCVKHLEEGSTEEANLLKIIQAL